MIGAQHAWDIPDLQYQLLGFEDRDHWFSL